MKVTKIKVMADYSADGLIWDQRGVGITMSSLRLSQSLIRLHQLWVGWYEDGYMEISLKKKPLPPRAAQFHEIGMFIAREIKRCRPKLEVSYRDESMKLALPIELE